MDDQGERVVLGSRRPDGTYRKERRIRAGYTPQDEQPTYVSVGAAVSGWLRARRWYTGMEGASLSLCV